MAEFRLSTFRRDMDQVIQRLNSGRSACSPHRYIQCQILLVRFMTDVIAARAAARATPEDEEMLENMEFWEEKCEHAEDLVKAFSFFIS
jgi:DNA-binding FadR family transcriptional regulator